MQAKNMIDPAAADRSERKKAERRIALSTTARGLLSLGSVAAVVGTLMLTGCATPQRCPNGVKDVYCASMKDTYSAARAGGGTNDNVLGGSPAQVKGEGTGSVEGKAAAGYLDMPSGRHQLVGPVYRQAKPYRLWVAPWTDANGIVHSGEYMYFTTPGSWNYGPLDLPGSASGVMGPAIPTDLGFTPVEAQRPSLNGALEQGQGQGPGTPDPKDPNSITKPAVRLGQGTDIELRQ